MKFRIKTLGCKVNQYESQAIAEKLKLRGCKPVEKNADLYIINTCAITKSAEKKSKKMISAARQENPKAKIIAAGCLVEAEKKITEKTQADLTVSQKNKPNLVKIFFSPVRKNPSLKSTWELKIKKYPNRRAFLKIQDGCNLFCSFCLIPYLRPKPTSRPPKEIIKEAARLSLSHKEIVLCGINLSLYGKDLSPAIKLSSLIKELLPLKTLGRLRLSSLQPLFVSPRLISLLSHPKMCPHLHFSFQYGENTILKAMNKKETTELYLKKVKAVKKICPRAAISCDIIVGFPGETETTFKKTLNFLEKVKPMRTHIFSFSPRKKTPLEKAALPEASLVKKRRQILFEKTKEFSRQYAESFLNRELEMIAEENKNNYLTGYTQNYIKVSIKKNNKQEPAASAVKLGSMLKVKITRIDKNNRVYAQKI